MIQLRPNQADLQRLKEPFGRLLLGSPARTMSELNSIISQTNPRRVTDVGDVVSRETLVDGIRVDLRILDHISMKESWPPSDVIALEFPQRLLRGPTQPFSVRSLHPNANVSNFEGLAPLTEPMSSGKLPAG